MRGLPLSAEPKPACCGTKTVTRPRNRDGVDGPLIYELTTMTGFDLFSIGHSNIPLARFIAMLQHAGVTAVADVRANPVSRFCPWFSGKPLALQLRQHDIDYRMFGDTLGGRPRDPALYRDDVADYEAMGSQPAYRRGIDDLLATAASRRVCIMCAEREPLDCHRCLLVARSLAERGMKIGHILHDGRIEPHAAIERRLLGMAGSTDDLFATGQEARLAAAYRHRAHAVAYRIKRFKANASRGEKAAWSEK